MKILKYLTAGCTIISIISGVTSFIMGDTLNVALDKFGLPFTEVSDKSWWNPKEEMYYLCEKDSRKFRSRLDNTQLSTTHIEIPYIPWTWEPFES